METNDITRAIIGAAIEVHRELGPGLLESAYEACLAFELSSRGFAVERQKKIPVIYKGRPIGRGYRLDLLVNESVIVELKSAQSLEDIHTAVMLTYLKLTGFRTGLILNFNVPVLKNGIRRVVL